jgi:hypothetical protein
VLTIGLFLGGQMDDLLAEVYSRISRRERCLVVTLTKRMSEELSTVLNTHGIRADWMHSGVKVAPNPPLSAVLRFHTFQIKITCSITFRCCTISYHKTSFAGFFMYNIKVLQNWTTFCLAMLRLNDNMNLSAAASYRYRAALSRH